MHSHQHLGLSRQAPQWLSNHLSTVLSVIVMGRYIFLVPSYHL